MSNYQFLLSDLTTVAGIGEKTANILKKKRINKIFDLLLSLPYSYIDRTQKFKIKDLQVGKVCTVDVFIKKYSFPRVRNLPNKVICEDETGILDCVFFNSYEGYIRKILPLNNEVTISGKINYYKNRYQITNPKYVSKQSNLITKVQNKYNLTEGITEKTYEKIITQVLNRLPNLDEWLSRKILKKFNNLSWKQSILRLHNPKNINDYDNDFFNRLAFDEILATLLVFSEIRKSIKKNKKKIKKFNHEHYDYIKKKIKFELTNDQKKALSEINKDLNSSQKMFRILQGDVGTGKTIVALISSLNVINSGYQVAFMAPTEILAKQHYSLAKRIFPDYIKIDLLSGKTDAKSKKVIQQKIENHNTDIVFGTHSLFQKKIKYSKLGYIVIDEQHKFGLNRENICLIKEV